MTAKFIIVYSRAQRAIKIFETYSDSGEAVARRLELEASYAGPEWEVALLASASEDSPRATHSRYFARETSAA